MVTYSMEFIKLEEPILPPPQTPRTGEEKAADHALDSFNSPKVVVFPSDAIVEYSMSFVGLLLGAAAVPENHIARSFELAPPIPLLARRRSPKSNAFPVEGIV